MKQTSSLIIFLLFVFVSCGQSKAYIWTQVLSPGNGRFPENWTHDKFPMGIIPLVAFNNDLYMVGQKKTWISKDGINWTAHSKTDWGERHGMTITFFKGKLWMMGGMKTWDKFHNDIWSSEDGKLWRQVKLHAGWSERRGHSVIVYNNKLWLLGGSVSSGKTDQLPTKLLNDVWLSENGETWTNVSRYSEWSARELQVINFNNKLYLVGGSDKNDVWSSKDGKQWTLVTNKAKWSKRKYYGLLVFDKKLWFFGGSGYNDVWVTTNGQNWIQQSSAASWSTRTAYHSVIYLNKLWIYSGKTGREDSWSGDVWTMTKYF
jgi:leucine-zipper-like transcriptional regulator 1